MVTNDVVFYGGWKNSIPDHRDFKLALAFTSDNLPKTSPNNAGLVNWVYNQSPENSCTSQAGASLSKYVMIKDKWKVINPSRNFIYWNERIIEGDTNRDEGAQMRTVLKALAQYGVCDESAWEFNNSTLWTAPNQNCYNLAKQNIAQIYMSVNQDLLSMRSCLASGYPFIIGISVYQSFISREVAVTGIVPMPNSSEKQLGGHAISVFDYDDNSKTFKCLNSWGEGWGQKGWFTIPYAYLENNDLADDSWTLRNFTSEVAVAPPPSPVKGNDPGWNWWI